MPENLLNEIEIRKERGKKTPQQQQLLPQQLQWHVMHLQVPSPSLQHDSLHSLKSSHDQE